jgi:hypothetical protein
MASSAGYLNTHRVILFSSYSDYALSVAHEYLVVIASDPGRDGHVLLYPYQYIQSVMTSFYLLEI